MLRCGHPPQLLKDRPIPQLTVQEKEEVPPIQKQSKISFISDKEVALFVQQKEPEQEDHEITVSD